tara:strand:+ start:142 stop:1074 length:933 start_codon:yes stop_codon:yes gene_type:complete
MGIFDWFKKSNVPDYMKNKPKHKLSKNKNKIEKPVDHLGSLKNSEYKIHFTNKKNRLISKNKGFKLKFIKTLLFDIKTENGYEKDIPIKSYVLTKGNIKLTTDEIINFLKVKYELEMYQNSNKSVFHKDVMDFEILSINNLYFKKYNHTLKGSFIICEFNGNIHNKSHNYNIINGVISNFKNDNQKLNPITLKDKFIERIKSYDLDFNNNENFIVQFWYNGGQWCGFLGENERFGNEKNTSLIHQIIEKSNIIIDPNGFGTKCELRYHGRTNSLFLYSCVIGEIDSVENDLIFDDLEDEYGTDYKVEILF